MIEPGYLAGLDNPQWRDDAVAAVLDSLYLRYPDLTQQFGPGGKNACRQDLHHHLDYLAGARLANDPGMFEKYALWLKSVLESRGVPSQHLVESLELLAAHCADQLPAAQAEPLCAILRAGQQALKGIGLPMPYVELRLPALLRAAPYQQALLSGNHRAAGELMQAAMRSGCSLPEASVRLIQPAMYDIGRLWQENRITVAKEHLATAITQNVLAHAYLQASFAPPKERSAMFAGVAGNHHSLGLRMMSDAFETVGWQAVYLGGDVPTGALLREVDASRPDLLCLSLSMPIHLATAREAVAALRAEMGSRCPTIWVGGQGTLLGKRVWQALDADGWAYDALQALEQLAA